MSEIEAQVPLEAAIEAVAAAADVGVAWLAAPADGAAGWALDDEHAHGLLATAAGSAGPTERRERIIEAARRAFERGGPWTDEATSPPLASAPATRLHAAGCVVVIGRAGDAIARVADLARAAASLLAGAHPQPAEIGADPEGRVTYATDAAQRLLGRRLARGDDLDTGLGLGAGVSISATAPAEILRCDVEGAGGAAIAARAEREGADGPPGHLTVRLSRRSDRAEALAVRDALVAGVRHDVRGPLTVLRGVAATLIEEPDMGAADREDFMRALERESGRVAASVEDLVTLWRLALGLGVQRLEERDLGTAVASHVEALAEHADARGVRLDLRIDRPSAPIRAERGLLDRMLSNLLTHGLRTAAREASIAVSLDVREAATVLTVCGPGPAPAEHHRAHPLTSSWRAHAAAKHAPGAGVGLHAVKCVADAHGWGVSYRVTGDGRQLIRVTFPAAPGPA